MSEHLASSRDYWLTWGGLLLLTALTFALSYVDLGAVSIPVAILIASVKALLVALFFMHLLEQRSVNGIIFLIAVCFVALLVGLTAMDVATR